MRQFFLRSAAVATVTAIWQSTAFAAPAYQIIPFTPVGTDSVGTGQGISENGLFATGYTQRSSGTTTTAGSNGVLYNISNGTTTVQSQTGVIYGSNTVENFGAPYSVNNQGVMFGSSGATSAVTTGEPTVFQNGQAYSLPLPLYSGAGQVYGSNNLNLAVGSVGSASGGLNQAALFHYYGAGNGQNFTTDLTQGTVNGGTLQTAYGINDNLQIVGTANDPNSAALTVPFFLDLNTGNAASVIPTSSTAYNSGIPFAISGNGLVTGSESFYGSSGVPFLYNSSSGTTVALPLVYGASQGGARGVNNSGEVVGTDSGLYALPYLYDGTSSYLLSSLLVNNTTGAWHLSDNTSSGGFGIADNGDIVGRGFYNGVLTGFLMVPTGGTIVTPQTLTFTGSGDGTTWDTTQLNFNNGSAATTFSGAAGDYVTFNDGNNGHYTVNIPTTVTPGATVISNNAGNYVFNGAANGAGIGGTGGLSKSGTGSLTLNVIDTYAGTTSFSGGTVTLAVQGAIPRGSSLTINGTATKVIVSSLGTAYTLQVGTLSIYSGTLDLQNNDLIAHSGNFSSLNTLLKSGYGAGTWNGSTGVISSLAGAANPLMALGLVINDTGAGTKTPLYGSGGTIASTFGGASPVDGDFLIKYTYYGDANLDGKVDGSDYSLIDNGYAKKLTGWLNGDFNYDAVVDGTDYTLIDNAFNNQGAQVAAVTAEITDQVAGPTAAVPEPAGLALAAVGLFNIVKRRRRV